MSPWILLLSAALIVLAAWALMPRPGPAPEIHGGLRLLWWLDRAYCTVWHHLETDAPAALPEHGPALLIANHTCGVDPLLLQAGCRRVLGFVIAQEIYDYWLFHPICKLIDCIPVRRDGHDLAATRGALRALKEGRVVPIFPEGKIIPTSGRTLGEGKPGVAFLALRAGVPVIPAYICGTPPTNQIWKALRTPSKARVLYGPPIDLSDIPADRTGDRAVLLAVTQRLMDAIAALRDEARQRERGDDPQDERDEPRRPDRGAERVSDVRPAARSA